jgi:hypothetical protein
MANNCKENHCVMSHIRWVEKSETKDLSKDKFAYLLILNVYWSDSPFLIVHQLQSFERYPTTYCHIPEYLNFYQHCWCNMQFHNSDSALQSTFSFSNTDIKPLMYKETLAVDSKNYTENIQHIAKCWVTYRLYVQKLLGFTALRMHAVQFCSLSVPVGTYINFSY